MASFTDEVVNFTPYRPENPVEAMLQVGLTKQQKYAEGLQKIQTYVDTVGSLDVSKQEIKDYIQGKLTTLHQNLNNVSGDFSDQRLVTQIGGAASKIANDPVVQNGIIATNEIRSGYQKIEAARKEGKSNLNNELFFTDAVARWQNDGQVDTRFSGQYTPYFDIVKKVRETFKDMTGGQDLPEGFSLEGSRVDENGNPVFNINYAKNMVLMEGIGIERVQRAVDLVMQDGNARQQLMIDGYVKFRGADGNMMYNTIVDSTQKNLKILNEAIKAGQTKLGASTAGDKTRLINEIKTLKTRADQMAAKADSYIQALGTNPEGVKAQIVEDELTSNLIGAFAYQKMVQSPLWNQNIELEKFRLSQQQFVHQQIQDERNFALNKFKAETDAAKEAAAKKEKTPNNYVANLPVPNTEGGLGQYSFNIETQDKLAGAKAASFQALSEYASITRQVAPYVLDPKSNEWVPNADGFGGGAKGTAAAQLAAVRLTMDMKSMRSNGVLNPDVAAAMQKEESAWDGYYLSENRTKEIESSVKEPLDKVRKTVGTRKDGSAYPTDWFDYYTARKKLPGWEAAAARLDAKYTPDWKLLGVGNKNSPVYGNLEEYNDLEKKLNSDPSIVQAARIVEDKFRGSQFAFQNKATVFDRSKPEIQQDVKTAFSAALTEQSLASPGGDAASMKEWISDETKEQANDQYMAWQESKGGKTTWWIGIQRGTDLKKVQITEAAFRQNTKLQEAIPNVEFKNRFGDRLALRGGKDTYKTDRDIAMNNGQVSAYPLFVGPGNITYTGEDGQPVEGMPIVQYHLEEPATARGKYRIRLYITDGKTGKVLVPGVPYPPADMFTPGETPALSQEQVISMLDRTLSNPVNIQGYIERYYNKK